ncbi:hypothetical protein [Erythrobacter sp. YT30]|uniref:hypothetical protein n=1 Tax=Erythrobacter sp. YT30 TaxID=1735012 RepID=UPI00076C6335|nr:hypothetical protein [Erythrobacter sp. YT30]KWV91544.1 hypothetical protein AUC45_09940 [Erythrobacter sp. YT30]
MRAQSRSSGRFAIASHPIFKPALIAWAALIVALAILILPANLIERLSLLTSLSILGENARVILAVIGAVAGGTIGFGVAAMLKRKLAGDHGDFEEEEETVLPIDPAEELGSDSLDAPIETAEFEEIEQEAPAAPEEVEAVDEVSEEPAPTQGRRRSLAQLARGDADKNADDPDLIFPNFGSEEEPELEVEQPEIEAETADEGTLVVEEPQADKRSVDLPDIASAQSALDALISSGAAPFEPAAEVEIGEASEDVELAQPPRSMGLEEFGAMPGRNAVWVEEIAEEAEEFVSIPESESEAEPAPVMTEALSPEIPAALAKLRATPIEELSMMQMMERFAAALEDRKRAEKAQTGRLSDPAEKQAFAHGLRELNTAAGETRNDIAQFEDSNASEIDVETESAKLRDALDKLADLRGAA